MMDVSSPNADFQRQFEASIVAFAARERAWMSSDRRGRWVVLEAGIGRLLKDAEASTRRYVDAVVERRARRFSSLSRARAFANQVGGVVRRWRRKPPASRVPGIRKVWVRASAWEWANRRVTAARKLPLFVEVGETEAR